MQPSVIWPVKRRSRFPLTYTWPVLALRSPLRLGTIPRLADLSDAFRPELAARDAIRASWNPAEYGSRFVGMWRVKPDRDGPFGSLGRDQSPLCPEINFRHPELLRTTGISQSRVCTGPTKITLCVQLGA